MNIYDTAQQYPGMEAEIRQWHDRWIDLAGPVIDGSVALMRKLRSKDVPVMALSNFGIENFAYAQTRFDFLNEFDQLFVSGHLGVTKPSPDIYRQVEATCGHPPETLFFTDDRAENITAARARGWQTHRFESSRKLGEQLVAHGLLDSADMAGISN
jgi:2-haloacid dehalogenase